MLYSCVTPNYEESLSITGNYGALQANVVPRRVLE